MARYPHIAKPLRLRRRQDRIQNRHRPPVAEEVSLVKVRPWVLAEIVDVERAVNGSCEFKVRARSGRVGGGEVGSGGFGGGAFGGDEPAGRGGRGTDAAVGFPDVAVALPVGSKERR